jgi:hypothetical protein
MITLFNLRKKVKCKGEQIHLKTELKLLNNNLNFFCFSETVYRKKQFSY